MIAPADRWLFAVLVIAVAGYVLSRALLVPLVHDEATSFLAYAQPGHLLPFASMWDANQHYLNSFLGFLGHQACGLSLLALRWGSVLAFLVYAWSAWRLGELIVDRRLRWILWLGLLTCPFLLDFFSLFRGYGLAMAFWLFALDGLLRYWRSGVRGDLMRSLSGLLFADVAILALVPTWGIVLLVLLACWRKGRGERSARESVLQLGLWIGCGALPFGAASWLSITMARLDLLYHGATEGFTSVTLASLMRYVSGTSEAPVLILVIVLVVGASFVAAAEGLRTRDMHQPLVIVSLVLWLEIAGRVMLARSFGINYPEDRTALHLVPLAIAQITFAADVLARRRAFWALTAAPLLFLPIRSLATVNLDHTLLWPEQSTPYRFSQRLHELEGELGRPAVVGAYRLSGLNWSLQQRMLGREGDIYALDFPSGLHDARIVDDRFLHEAMEGYREVDRAPGNGLHLLIRDPALQATEVLDTSYVLEVKASDRSPTLELSVAELRTHDLLIEIGGAITSSADVLDLRLGIAVTDTSGSDSHGDIVFLSTRRVKWRGDSWRTIRYLPKQPAARSLRVFFWEPDSVACRIADGRLILRTIEP